MTGQDCKDIKNDWNNVKNNVKFRTFATVIKPFPMKNNRFSFSYILVFAAVVVALSCGGRGSKVQDGEEAGNDTETSHTMRQQGPVFYSYKVRNVYPHDTDSYTQGLYWDNGYLWEGTGEYGNSKLRKVRLDTGMPVKEISLAEKYFGEGITIYKDKIFQLTWTSRKGFVYDISSFALETTFDYDSQGWGLTTMGDTLVMSDGSHKLYLLDPDSFSILKTIEVYDNKGAVTNLNELEYINGKIWANVWLTDRIVVINPKTGAVTEELLLPDLLTAAEKARLDSDDDVLNGIAYNEQKGTIYVTGKHWPKLFEIRIK